jgi:DNA-binding response OmpR family regulator
MRSQARRLSPQPWPWVGQPRVLIEHADESVGLELASMLRGAGYAVAVCPGPAREEHCPLTGPEGCAVAHGADVVVSSLGNSRPEAREVLAALRERCPATPIVVVAPLGESHSSWSDLPAECTLIGSPVVPEELVSSVRTALAGSQAEA